MKALLYFLLIVFAGSVVIASYFWGVKDIPLDEQIEYVQSKFFESMEDTPVSNTTESATRLGKVLKNSFDEAQDVYENGAEARYE